MVLAPAVVRAAPLAVVTAAELLVVEPVRDPDCCGAN